MKINICEFLLSGIASTILASAVSIWIAQHSVKQERKKMVDEIRRNVYFEALRCLTRLQNDPTLIFDSSYYNQLLDLKLSIEVYDTGVVWSDFEKWFQKIKEKYMAYLNEFEGEDADSIRESMQGLPFYKEMEQHQRELYEIDNMPNISEVDDLTNKLKENIKKILRNG